jgi:hypothetical protein
MDRCTIDILTKPFPEAAIKTRRGSHGKELHYLEIWRVVDRLNAALEHDWSFRIVEWKVVESEVVVHAEIAAGLIVKQAFGSSQVTRRKESGDVVSLGDDVKAAASDALKKAATLLGVGLELYAGRSGQGSATITPSNTSSSARKGTGRAEEAMGSAPTPSSHSRISERQLSAILALAKSKGEGEVGVRTRILDSFGVPVEKLDRRQASEVISALNNGGFGQKAGVGGAR